MFIELRQYRIRPGKIDEWVDFTEEAIIPFQTSKGMEITGGFRDEEDDTLYFWCRRFDYEEARIRLYDAVYNSDKWRDGIAPRVQELMDGPPISVRRLMYTSRSPRIDA